MKLPFGCVALGAALFLSALLAAPARAWGPRDDEANRQRMMNDMRASAAAGHRASFNSLQRSNEAHDRSYGSSSGSSGRGGTGSSGGGFGAPATYQPSGPRSIVATYNFTIRRQESAIQAAARLEGEAAAGNAQSAFDLGRILYTGYGGAAHDEARARGAFCRAAALGHAPAQTQCGLMLYRGLAGAKDEAAGLGWLKKAADADDSYGQALYGLFVYGRSTRTRLDAPAPEAIAYLQKAADRGEMVAESALGTAYLFGVGVPKDEAKAFAYNGRAAAKGDRGAMNDLSTAYLYGHGVAKDPAQGLSWTRKSAELGFPPAMTVLGKMSMIGDAGAAKDEKAAAVWFRKAAEAGDPEGAALYALLLIEGRVVPKNEAAGARFARVAADGGNALGQQLTAKAYYFGWGGPKDLEESARWFKRAAAQGDKESVEALKEADIAAAAKTL